MMHETDYDKSVLNVLGVAVEILKEDSDPENGHTVSYLECEAGLGIPMHRHKEVEGFYVLEGELTLYEESQEVKLTQGQFHQVASNKPHRFANNSAGLAKFLNFSIPSGHAKFFREADVLTRSGNLTPETAAEVCRSNGIELV